MRLAFLALGQIDSFQYASILLSTLRTLGECECWTDTENRQRISLLPIVRPSRDCAVSIGVVKDGQY